MKLGILLSSSHILKIIYLFNAEINKLKKSSFAEVLVLRPLLLLHELVSKKF